MVEERGAEGEAVVVSERAAVVVSERAALADCEKFGHVLGD